MRLRLCIAPYPRIGCCRSSTRYILFTALISEFFHTSTVTVPLVSSNCPLADGSTYLAERFSHLIAVHGCWNASYVGVSVDVKRYLFACKPQINLPFLGRAGFRHTVEKFWFHFYYSIYARIGGGNTDLLRLFLRDLVRPRIVQEILYIEFAVF